MTSFPLIRFVALWRSFCRLERKPGGYSARTSGMTTSVILSLALFCVTSLVRATSARAQPPVARIDARDYCRTCSLDTARIAVLRPPSDQDAISYYPSVAVGASGQYFVTVGPSRIMIFDPAGRFVRTFGRAGDGPGEFRAIIGLAFGSGDSLFVFENNRRIHVLDPQLRHIRTLNPVSNLIRAVVRRDGSFLARSQMPGGAASANYAAYLFDSDAQSPRPVGPPYDPIQNSACGGCQETRVHASKLADHVWVTAANRYQLELQRDAHGAAVRRLEVLNAPWFQDWERAERFSEGVHPRSSSVLSLMEGERDRIWVFGIHTPVGWRPADGPLGPLARAGAPPAIGVGKGARGPRWEYEVSSKFESVIDLVDVSMNRLIGTVRIPGEIHALGPAHVYRVRELPDGEVVIDVFRIVLREGS